MEYKNTIITPKTSFPMKAGLPAREPNMLARWEEQELYEQMLEKNKKGGVAPRTAHSLNPVPFIVYDPAERHELKEGTHFGLANVAPTIVDLMGIEPFASWEESMLKH